MSRPTLLKQEHEEFAKSISHKGMVDKARLVESFGVSEKTVERLLKKLGLSHTSQHLIDAVLRYEAGEEVPEIAKSMGVTSVNINAFFRRIGLHRRNSRTYFNESYFKEIDSEDKAYFLGFILADGCIYNNRVCLGISDTDVGILERFKAFLDTDKKIYKSSCTGISGKVTNICRIELISDKMVDDLAKLSILPNKTLHCKYPSDMIGSTYERDFIRGIWDGDGTISQYLSKRGDDGAIHNKYHASVCGTLDICESLRERLRPILEVEGYISKRFDTENCCYTLSYSGGKCVGKLMKYLYEESSVSLDRKYDKAMSIVRNTIGSEKPTTSELHSS